MSGLCLEFLLGFGLAFGFTVLSCGNLGSGMVGA